MGGWTWVCLCSWLDPRLLSLRPQRGKGAFYLGVGLLTFFISPDTKGGWTGARSFPADCTESPDTTAILLS